MMECSEVDIDPSHTMSLMTGGGREEHDAFTFPSSAIGPGYCAHVVNGRSLCSAAWI
jgi:hypothetical protein